MMTSMLKLFDNRKLKGATEYSRHHPHHLLPKIFNQTDLSRPKKEDAINTYGLDYLQQQ